MPHRLMPHVAVLATAGLGLACLARPSQAAPPRVAVLGALPPATDGRLAGDTLASLTRQGYQATLIRAEDVADPARLATARVDLLVVPHADTFPAAAQAALLAYLRAGGKLMCLGGPPFSRYVYRTPQGWQTREAALERLPSAGALVDIGKADVRRWARGSSTPAAPASISVTQSPHGPALRLRFERFEGWDNFAPPAFAQSPFPPGAEAMAFWARGDAQTDALVVEWRERDGSRWIGSVPLTTQWKRYTMLPGDFRYWQDSQSAGRGGPQDRFHPGSAQDLRLGLAQSHAAMRSGPKTLWIAGLGAARMPAGMPPVEPPVLEGLSPWYKVASYTPPAGAGGQAMWLPVRRYRGATAVQPPGRLAIASMGQSGTTEWVYRAYSGPYAGAAWGAINRAIPPFAGAQALTRPWYLAHAGPLTPSFRRGQPLRVVARLENRGAAAVSLACKLMWTPAGDKPASVQDRPSRTSTVNVGPRSSRTVSFDLGPAGKEGDWTYDLTVEDAAGGHDWLGDQFMVVPEAAPSGGAVQVAGGEFTLEGKPWRPVGINYWPTWVSGQDRDEYWASWMSPNQYDPGLVEQDLTTLQRLGMNVVSIQYLRPEQAPSLVDFLARCRNHAIRANVFLAGGYPLGPNPQQLTDLIRAARLHEDPAVFAYDVAWEPHVGDHAARRSLDGDWRQWILDQYGSTEKAERDWGFAAPREDGRVSNPADEQLTQDGPWRRVVAAYRRFVDDRISRGYREVRQAIRAVDARHLIGARSGYGGNGSLYVEGVMAFDLRAGAKHLDFISPEGYSLVGDWPAVRGGGGFTTAYARWAGDGKPVFWSEFGRSVYPQTTPAKVAEQGEYYELIYRMVMDAGANGSAGWWWPGGLRIDENSDYGVVEPSGQPRPAALKTQQYAPRIAAMALPPAGQRVEIPFDRDADARGYAGVWMAGRSRWLAEREKGSVPALRTDGTNTTTATMPLVAVGNVPADGANPLKYANAELEAAIEADGRVSVTAGNTGEAAWAAAGAGRVALMLKQGGHVIQEVALGADVPRFGDAVWRALQVPTGTEGPLQIRLAIHGRGDAPIEFGETLTVGAAGRRP